MVEVEHLLRRVVSPLRVLGRFNGQAARGFDGGIKVQDVDRDRLDTDAGWCGQRRQRGLQLGGVSSEQAPELGIEPRVTTPNRGREQRQGGEAMASGEKTVVTVDDDGGEQAQLGDGLREPEHVLGLQRPDVSRGTRVDVVKVQGGEGSRRHVGSRTHSGVMCVFLQLPRQTPH